ncbi:hypothetical protein Tco_0611198 [Tanacetum coccineum]
MLSCGLVVSSGWSFVSAILGQMSYLVASSTLVNAGSFMCCRVIRSHKGNDFQYTMVGSIKFLKFLASCSDAGGSSVLGVYPVGPGVQLLGLLALAIDAACVFRAEEMPSLISICA